MTFKEFRHWCNRRAADGCWGMIEAMVCCQAVSDIQKEFFWRREKIWQEKHAKEIIEQIVEPTNAKIKEICGEDVDPMAQYMSNNKIAPGNFPGATRNDNYFF